MSEGKEKVHVLGIYIKENKGLSYAIYVKTTWHLRMSARNIALAMAYSFLKLHHYYQIIKLITASSL
jgi:hypothetical protein